MRIDFHHSMVRGINSPLEPWGAEAPAQPLPPPGKSRVPSYLAEPEFRRPCQKQRETSRPLNAPDSSDGGRFVQAILWAILWTVLWDPR